MTTDYTRVTTEVLPTDEVAELLAHADHIEDVIEALRGPSDRSLNAQISDAHNELGMTLKRADIVASLAVADAVDRLREALVSAAVR